MKIKFLVALLLLSFSNQVLSQSTFTETVYLKNGSIVKGSIVEWVPNESISLKLADGSVFVFKISEITKVSRSLPDENVKVSSTKQLITDTARKYESQVSFGYGSNVGKYGLNVLSYNWVYGINIKPKHYIGAGTGLRYYSVSDQDGSITMIPIIFDYKYRLNNNQISPYAKMAAGYSLNITTGFDNSGFLINPRLGVDFALGGTSIFVELGYHSQQMSFGLIKEPFTGIDGVVLWNNNFNNSSFFPAGMPKVFRFSESINFHLGIAF